MPTERFQFTGTDGHELAASVDAIFAAAYMAGAMRCYEFRHIERGTGMILKAIGLPAGGDDDAPLR